MVNALLTIGEEIAAPNILECANGPECDYREAAAPVAPPALTSYVKIRSTWRYLSRAIDKHANPINVLLTAKRDFDAGALSG